LIMVSFCRRGLHLVDVPRGSLGGHNHLDSWPLWTYETEGLISS
jgi:hypothetical protein